MELARVLDEIRSGRYAHGVRCPRCGWPRAHRWGSFSGRQRYRCRGCGRTFSDLTATPAAYLKKTGLLRDFAGAMTRGSSLRRAAAQFSISTSTAFRWRHRLCGALATRRCPLSGVVEVTLRYVPESRKGTRVLHRRRDGGGTTRRAC